MKEFLKPFRILRTMIVIGFLGALLVLISQFSHRDILQKGE